jgi:hypothetical protein
MKRIYVGFLFFVLTFSNLFATEPVVNADLQGVDISTAEWKDFRGNGVLDGLVIQDVDTGDSHTSRVIVFTKQNDHYLKLWDQVFEGNYVQFSSADCLEKGSKIPFVILGVCAGASIGCQYPIYRWDEKNEKFQKVSTLNGWNLKVDDIRSSGEKEIVIYDRYGEDRIFAFQNGSFELTNDLFPEYFQKINVEPSEENIKQCIEKIKEHDQDSLQSDFYCLQLAKFKNQEIMETLEEGTKDLDPKVRTFAIHAISGVWSQPKKVVQVLSDVIAEEKGWASAEDECVGYTAVSCLNAYGKKAVSVLPLLKKIENQYPNDRKLQKHIERTIGYITLHTPVMFSY